MQFSCESCKATLRIADEKVRGKRLVVRCKKCGARIQIADPALGPAPTGAAPLSPSSAPAPASEPAAAEPAPVERDTDIESTQAIDSNVLAKALRVSKGEDATPGAGLDPVMAAPQKRAPAAAEPASKPAPAAPAAEPAATRPRDPSVWFAMIAGKQQGPMTRAELGIKVAQGTATPRTYLWKEGMAGWVRALEVTEFASLFAPAPEKSAPPVAAPARAPSPGNDDGARGMREFSSGDFGELKLGDAAGDEESGRGRQRMEPAFARHEFGGGSEHSQTGSNSGIDIPLDLGEPAPRVAAAPPVQKAAANPAPKATSTAPVKAERAFSSDPLVPASEADDEDRTHVEPLPLGERIHQEEVAKELFSNSDESNPVSVSAKDLATWASKELGGRRVDKVLPVLAKAPVPTEPLMSKAQRSAPKLGGAAQERQPDPFDSVPDSPHLSQPDPRESTGAIIERLGVKKSQTPKLVMGIVAVVAVIGLFVSLLARREQNLGTPEAQAERKALGGTGESINGLLQGKTSGSEAQGGQATNRPRKVAVAQTDKPRPEDARTAESIAQEKAAAQASAQDVEALKALADNDRGIGTHGPKVDAAVAAPDTSKGDTGLSADDIKKKLGENKGALQSCIDDALRKEPNLRVGKIHIATTIAPSGAVTSAKIDKRNVDDSPLGGCLKRATRRIVFPSFAGEAFEVDIPILVTAGD